MKYSQVELVLKTRYSEFKYADDLDILQMNEGIFATRKSWLKDAPTKSIFYGEMISDRDFIDCDKDNMVVVGVEGSLTSVFKPSQEDLEADDWMYAAVVHKHSLIFKE